MADADVVIYVAARENSKCSEGVLAYASHCFIDKSTDRYFDALFVLTILHFYCMVSECEHECVSVCVLVS